MSIVNSITSAFVPIHREGYRFIAIFAGVTLVLFWLDVKALAWLGVVATAWCAYFFRDPERVTPQRAGLVISPADGRISAIEKVIPPPELDLEREPTTRISVFMNVFDVHVNRSPLDAKIARITYIPGAFLNAELDKASEDNERQAFTLELADGGKLGVVQIAGLIARRIVKFVSEGERLAAGQRLGLIRFGSRVDVYLPKGKNPLVSVGQRAIAGETVFADLTSPEGERLAREELTMAADLEIDVPKKPASGRRFKQVPVRFLLPNLITLLALCSGITAIRLGIEGRYELAVSAVIVSIVLDALDGRLARFLKGTSRFGAELDSLADFVNFGVAPAILIYLWSLNDLRTMGWVVALILAVCCALRLARFNVALDDADKPEWSAGFFSGAPAPAGAGLALLPMYIGFLGFFDDGHTYSLIIAPYIVAVALLMVSRVPTYSGKTMRPRVPRDLVLPILGGGALAIVCLIAFPWETLTLMVLAYLALIPFSVRAYRRHKAADLLAKNI